MLPDFAIEEWLRKNKERAQPESHQLVLELPLPTPPTPVVPKEEESNGVVEIQLR